MPNPRPDSMVKQVSNNFWKLDSLNSLVHTPGQVVIRIPDGIDPKPRIGLFINSIIADSRDVVSAKIIGPGGEQPVSINEYTMIDKSIGLPTKLAISLNPVFSSSSTYSSITGYAVRFSN